MKKRMAIIVDVEIDDEEQTDLILPKFATAIDHDAGLKPFRAEVQCVYERLDNLSFDFLVSDLSPDADEEG